jgi:hypothetical protein
MLQVEPRAEGFGCRIGTIGPVVVSVFDTKPELGLLELMGKVQGEHVARYKQITSITIISMPKLDPPGADFRSGSAELSKRFQDAMTCTALVVLSTGMAAVVVRAFLAAFSLLVTQRRPQQTFRQIAPAVKWVQEQPDQHPEVKAMVGLTEAIEAFAASRAPLPS